MKRNHAKSMIVTERVDLDFVDEDGHSAALESEMVYDQRDPFAMSMVFKTLPPVTWTFARDLLMAGMYEPSGDGDVHIWPCLSNDGEAIVIFEFSSPDGQVLVQASLRQCTAFIARIQECVPLGEEGQYLNLDATISQLLGDAPDVSV